MIARVKRLELKGFRQKEAKKLTVFRDEKGKIVFERHVVKKAEDVFEMKEDKEEGPIDEKDEGKMKKQDEENVAEAYLTPAKSKKGGKKLSKDEDQSSSASDSKLVDGKKSTIRKAFKDEEDDIAEDISDSKKKKKDKRKKGKNPEEKKVDEETSKSKKKSKKGVSDGYMNEYGEWVEGEPENNYGEEEEPIEDKEVDEIDAEEALKKAQQELYEKEMLAKWEDEKEVMDFVKQHGTSSSEEDKAEKNRNKEQKLYLKLERKAKERYWYNLKSLVIHGNGLLSLLMINSMLMPRHVRFTMFFTNILLNFFWCAIIIKNSQQQLLLPDLVSIK